MKQIIITVLLAGLLLGVGFAIGRSGQEQVKEQAKRGKLNMCEWSALSPAQCDARMSLSTPRAKTTNVIHLR